ncbi:TPA: hypothetical protein ACXDAB_003443 [Clostridium botulinum]|uniref:hypothetical protein n=1 Tax=Clostridium botulinum TaxID=1491 RepID=UPI0021482EE0|nr:hypothetical protein [Clostridium botulinum]MCR1167320.1 hypothetical protein [Clostridium botulinum]
MQLPKVNGQVDADEVADIIVTHILAKVSNIYGNRIDNETRRELEQYTKEIIESVKREAANK